MFAIDDTSTIDCDSQCFLYLLP